MYLPDSLPLRCLVKPLENYAILNLQVLIMDDKFPFYLALDLLIKNLEFQMRKCILFYFNIAALTSIIHLDRNPNYPKLNTIIDVTGASSYHGFLPVMVRFKNLNAT